jgi:hypothetical protein
MSLGLTTDSQAGGVVDPVQNSPQSVGNRRSGVHGDRLGPIVEDGRPCVRHGRGGVGGIDALASPPEQASISNGPRNLALELDQLGLGLGGDPSRRFLAGPSRPGGVKKDSVPAPELGLGSALTSTARVEPFVPKRSILGWSRHTRADMAECLTRCR